jgi:hypothetical protein
MDLRDWGRKFPASERFVVLSQFGSQAILDQETQLVWERAPDTILYTFSSADPARCVSKKIGGRLGWRLPTRVELMSLLVKNVSTSVKLPGSHPFVGLVPGPYWTNDGLAKELSEGEFAKAVVNIGVPSVSYVHATVALARAWCVRG